METKSGIYTIKNIVNNKQYIGSSINPHKRKNSHFGELKNQKHKNIKLQRAYDKYGKDSFIFEVIEFVEIKEELIEKEQYYINLFKPEYNINLVANSSLGVKRSLETKEKIKQANLGLVHPAWRNEIKSKAQGGNNHWTKKKKFSEEAKQNMSKAQKELYKKGYKSPQSKPILQYSLTMEFVKEWESAGEAEKILGYSKSGICQCAKKKNKTSQGFIWRYKVEQELIRLGLID